MHKVMKTKLFRLLSNASQVKNEEMQRSYEEFTKQVKTVSQSEQEFSEIFRALNFIRIELDSVGSSVLYGQGEKCPKIYLP